MFSQTIRQQNQPTTDAFAFATGLAMGRAAFLAGRPAVPALDPAFRPGVAAFPGSTLPLLDGWHRGWSQACVDAE